MGADYDHLKKFVLASTRMQIEQRYHAALVTEQLAALTEAIKLSNSNIPKDLDTKLTLQAQLLGDSISNLEDFVDELITALENYANG